MRKVIIGSIAAVVAGGVAVFALTFKITFDGGTVLSEKIKTDLRMIVRSAELLRAATGRFPLTIEEISQEGTKNMGPDWPETPVDPWNRPYIYGLVEGKPRAVCLGRDGIPGGTGPDEDLWVMSDEGEMPR